jgi:S-adenosylmethionine:tRNA ribosyltransferase-isomerase
MLPDRCLVVLNDTKVIRARLLGKKKLSSGRVELLLTRKLERLSESEERWLAMGKASKGLREGTVLEFGDPAKIIATIEGRMGDDGLYVVRLCSIDDSAFSSALESIGHVPLPPYIRRTDDANDVCRYQTVFAKSEGAVAAPTAGLHITERILSELSARSIQVCTVTLHVGPGTFLPVKVDDLDDHPMHEEWYEVSPTTASLISQARKDARAVVAVGTTSVRTLEAASNEDGTVRAEQATTRLLIQPGYSFKVVDAMLTNFHLPKSTLLALVSAFSGRERILNAYAFAVSQRYRFFSYGDAMFLRAPADRKSKHS